MPGRADDDSAVTAQVGAILLVAVLLAVAVAVVLFTQQFTEEQESPRQKVTFTLVADPSGPGGRLEVVSVPGGPLDWSQVQIGGAAAPGCVAPTGPVEAGDVMACSADGGVSLVDTVDGTLLYLGEFR